MTAKRRPRAEIRVIPCLARRDATPRHPCGCGNMAHQATTRERYWEVGRVLASEFRQIHYIALAMEDGLWTVERPSSQPYCVVVGLNKLAPDCQSIVRRGLSEIEGHPRKKSDLQEALTHGAGFIKQAEMLAALAEHLDKDDESFEALRDQSACLCWEFAKHVLHCHDICWMPTYGP